MMMINWCLLTYILTHMSSIIINTTQLTRHNSNSPNFLHMAKLITFKVQFIIIAGLTSTWWKLLRIISLTNRNATLSGESGMLMYGSVMILSSLCQRSIETVHSSLKPNNSKIKMIVLLDLYFLCQSSWLLTVRVL